MEKDLEEIARQLRIHNNLMLILIAYVAPLDAVDAIDKLQTAMLDSIGSIAPAIKKD